MGKVCPHCKHEISESWHQGFGLQKLDKGWVEVGIPVVGRINLKREAIVMVYICERTNLPFLVALAETR